MLGTRLRNHDKLKYHWTGQTDAKLRLCETGDDASHSYGPNCGAFTISPMSIEGYVYDTAGSLQRFSYTNRYRCTYFLW